MRSQLTRKAIKVVQIPINEFPFSYSSACKYFTKKLGLNYPTLRVLLLFASERIITYSDVQEHSPGNFITHEERLKKLEEMGYIERYGSGTKKPAKVLDKAQLFFTEFNEYCTGIYLNRLHSKKKAIN